MVGLLDDNDGVALRGFLHSAQFEFEIAPQDIEIEGKFAGDGERGERLLETALRAQRQRRLQRIVHGRSGGALAELVHGSDATAVRVAPFLIRVTCKPCTSGRSPVSS